jgi:hypothetical protein
MAVVDAAYRSAHEHRAVDLHEITTGTNRSHQEHPA